MNYRRETKLILEFEGDEEIHKFRYIIENYLALIKPDSKILEDQKDFAIRIKVAVERSLK